MLPRFLGLLALALAVSTARADRVDSPLNRPGLPLRQEPVEVRLSDGSKLFLTLTEESLSVTTPYGKIEIKLADVQKIDFGLRTPPETVRKIDAAVAVLTGTDEKKAEAWAALTAAREYAYPALKQLARHSDRAIAMRAGGQLAKLREVVSADRLARIDTDVIHTEYSKIGGRIEMAEFRVMTPHFGPRKLRMGDLASLHRGPTEEPEEIPVNVQPDPGTPSNFQQHVGQHFYFRVTGAAGGSIWGSDVYTTDSSIAGVAVHAGVLKMGQTGIVKVTIMPGQNGYAGSTRNGISTSGYGQYPGSYKVSKVGRPKEED